MESADYDMKIDSFLCESKLAYVWLKKNIKCYTSIYKRENAWIWSMFSNILWFYFIVWQVIKRFITNVWEKIYADYKMSSFCKPSEFHLLINDKQTE